MFVYVAQELEYEEFLRRSKGSFEIYPKFLMRHAKEGKNEKEKGRKKEQREGRRRKERREEKGPLICRLHSFSNSPK